MVDLAQLLDMKRRFNVNPDDPAQDPMAHAVGGAVTGTLEHLLRTPERMIQFSQRHVGGDPYAAAPLADESANLATMLMGGGAARQFGRGASAHELGSAGGRAGRGKHTGAPPQINSPQAEAAMRKRYLELMQEGAEGRHWYDSAGATNKSLLESDLDVARFTGAQAVTSAGTPVDSNLGMAIKGHNQKMAGQPAKTGRFPEAMGERIDKVYGAGTVDEILEILGNKTGPYAENLMAGSGIAPKNAIGRSVHDLWDARAMGYPEETFAGGGLSPSQHKWMDGQMKKIVDEANRKQLGGVSDWDNRSGQAATWIAKKAKDEGVPIEVAKRDYTDFLEKYLAQGSYESVPGKTTEHLPGLRSAPIDVRNSHLEEVFNIMTDASGRDKIASRFGAPTSTSVKGPGVFEGDINPGVQTRMALGRKTGGEGVDDASSDLANAIEATRGSLLGQDAAAWHLPGNAGVPATKTGALDFVTGKTIGNDEMRSLIGAVKSRLGEGALERIAPIPTASGFRLLNFGDDAKGFVSAGRAIGKELGVTEVQQRAMLGGNLMSNDWKTNPLGQAYMAYIDRPAFQRSFDNVAPELAQRLYELDEPLSKSFGGPAASEVQKLRKIIANEGYTGLMRAIRNGAATVGAVGIMFEAIGQESRA